MAKKRGTMPNSLDAEMALICCMIQDNDILPDILDQLSDTDFYQESHRLILSAIKQVYYDRKPVDLVTLTDKMETLGTLEKAGGVSYLAELSTKEPSAANFRHYYDIVHRDSINRRLMHASQDIIEFCSTSDDELNSIQHAEKLVYDISQTNDTSSMKDIRSGEGLQEVITKFQNLAKDKNAYRGVMTGFTQLDRLTNGLQKGDLIVIAARPGMGKTSLSMNIVENAAIKQNKVCVVFSLEMPEVQILQRLLCSLAGVSMADALAGKTKPEDWKKILVAQKQLSDSRIFIDDSSRITPAEILSKCRRIKTKEKQLDLVMVDYIQLMSNGKDQNSEQNRAQVVADITRELKIMAKELDVPIIALSQLRRMLSKEPTLSDLRESGAIEQDADIVMFINRPDVNVTPEEMKKENIVKDLAVLNVAKHRNGALDRINLRFKGELTKFVNYVEGEMPTDLKTEGNYIESGEVIREEKIVKEETFKPLDENDDDGADPFS